MLVRVADHTLDLDLLPACPIVLDVGCRNFDFCRALLEFRSAARIIAMDPDPGIEDPQMLWVEFMHKALVHDNRKVSAYASFSTGEANFLTYSDVHYATILQVPCINIRDLMQQCGVEFWDVVKLDCEGSEFAILESWPGPIATQISVEFHDFTNRKFWDDAYFDNLWRDLPDYQVVRHDLSLVGTGWGHWDTVLVLKGRNVLAA